MGIVAPQDDLVSIMIEWKFGDRLVHAGKPEWGIGQVSAAEMTQQDGKRCQRVTVRFERGGVKTLSTAFADLRPADQAGFPRVSHEEPSDPLALAAENQNVQEAMCKIPETAVDPFLPMGKRLENTLNLYRFSDTGGSLIDWAVMQSGLKDPLSRFSRHDLERLFARYQMNVDNHLKKLVREMRRTEPELVAKLITLALPAAKAALRRVDAMR